jgi:hypothetical protein
MRTTLVTAAAFARNTVIKRMLPVVAAAGLVLSAGAALAAGQSPGYGGSYLSQQPTTIPQGRLSTGSAETNRDLAAQNQIVPNANDRVGTPITIVPTPRPRMNSGNDFNFMGGGGG